MNACSRARVASSAQLHSRVWQPICSVVPCTFISEADPHICQVYHRFLDHLYSDKCIPRIVMSVVLHLKTVAHQFGVNVRLCVSIIKHTIFCLPVHRISR